MAPFDVYANASREDLLLDCQADILSDLNTRFTVPLMRPDRAPTPGGRLNPSFDIRGQRYVMVTQYAGSLEVGELGRKVTSLADHDYTITNALDFLITGV